MSQSARSRTSVSSAASHGKIKTENPELLTLLRDRTRDNNNSFVLSRENSQHKRSLDKHSALQGERSVDLNNQNLPADSTPIVSARSNSVITKPTGNTSTPQNLNRGDLSDDENSKPTDNYTDQYPVPSLDLDNPQGTNRDSYSLLKSVDIDNPGNKSALSTAKSENLNSGNSEPKNKDTKDFVSISSRQNTQEKLHSDSYKQEHDKNLHESSAKSVSPPTAKFSENSPRARVSKGEGHSISQSEVDTNRGNTTERKRDASFVHENNSLDYTNSVVHANEVQHSIELDPKLSEPLTPATAPATGRQTYLVPSPVSEQIPNIDSLSNFSHQEERPSRKGSSLSVNSIPQPRQGNITPRQSSSLLSATAREPLSTQRSSSSVYAVANPAVLAAQGITPTPNQHHVQFTPRTKAGSGYIRLKDSLEPRTLNDETGETNQRSDSVKSEDKKSVVSFTEPEENPKHFPESDPYTAADSPAPSSEPDWGSPRVKDRVPTPHPHSPIKLGSSPSRIDQNSVESEGEREIENKSLERSESVQKNKYSKKEKSFERYQTPDLRNQYSPQPIGQVDREIQSAIVPASYSIAAHDKPIRTNSLPTVKRVYIDSPTFTREEEEEYRFVESRLGEIQDDVEETLRRLDEETLKQKNIRKQLEEQMASMYAPAYEDQPVGRGGMGGYSQGYNQLERDYAGRNRGGSNPNPGYEGGQNQGYGSQDRDRNPYNPGGNEVYSSNRDPYAGEPRRDNMGSHATLRNNNGEQRRDNMGSYATLRSEHGDQRRDNMGSYANLRNDHGGQRRDNMGSYATLRGENDNRSYSEQRRDNMGSYGNLRNDDRGYNNDPRQDNYGSYGNLRRENERDSYVEPRQDDMGPYQNSRKDSVQNSYRDKYGPQDSGPNGYGEQHRRGDNEQDERRSNFRTPYNDQNNRGNHDNEQREYERSYGDRRRESERYEDRDREMNRYEDQEKTNQMNNRYQFEDPDMRTEADRYDPVPHHGLNGNFESHDDELRRETEYQEGLKSRINESGQRDLEMEIPKIPIQSETFRDSLEEEGYGDWKNPPPNPYAPESEREVVKEYEEAKIPEFIDKTDLARMEVVNPREPTYDFVENNKIDYGKPPEKTYRDLKQIQEAESKKLDKIFIHPKLPPKKKPPGTKPALKSAPSKFKMQSPVEEFDPDSPAETLWAKRSAALKKKDNKSSSSGSLKRTKGLQKYPSESKLVRPSGSNPQISSGQVRMYSTPTRNHILDPMDHRAPPVPQPVAPQSEPANYGERQSPSFRRPLNLKPITQEIVTEDGQRISVDINLKVVSPPPGADTNYPVVTADVTPKAQQNRGGRPLGMQYQMSRYSDQNEQQQQYQYQDPQQYSEPPQQNYGQYNDYYNYSQYNYNYYDQNQQRYDGYGNQENMPPANQTNYATYRQQQQTDSSPDFSPYPKVPPIPLTDDEIEQQKEVDENGYAAMYKRTKESPQKPKPWYQVYTIKDYKKMQEELKVTRGTLGPDLDNRTHREKLENRHKQLEYAGFVMEKNKRELEGRKPVQVQNKKEDEHSKRKTAIEYSKNVPKPTVRMKPNQYNSYDVAAQMGNKQPTRKSPAQTLDVIDLQKLQQRHEQEKQNVATFRQNVESVPQKA